MPASTATRYFTNQSQALSTLVCKVSMLLESTPLYAPNEEDLKVASLKALYTSLKTTNTEVLTTSIQLSNARINRNEILYKPITGLVDIASDTKTYLKSVFGATSPQYKHDQHQ